MKREVEKILGLVQKPARYTGGELNEVIKNKDKVDLRYAFCFPDTYEIGTVSYTHLTLPTMAVV